VSLRLDPGIAYPDHRARHRFAASALPRAFRHNGHAGKSAATIWQTVEIPQTRAREISGHAEPSRNVLRYGFESARRIVSPDEVCSATS